MLVKCPRCHNRFTESLNFCPECGWKGSNDNINNYVYHCPNCDDLLNNQRGYRNGLLQYVCENCGERLMLLGKTIGIIKDEELDEYEDDFDDEFDRYYEDDADDEGITEVSCEHCNVKILLDLNIYKSKRFIYCTYCGEKQYNELFEGENVDIKCYKCNSILNDQLNFDNSNDIWFCEECEARNFINVKKYKK